MIMNDGHQLILASQWICHYVSGLRVDCKDVFKSPGKTEHKEALLLLLLLFAHKRTSESSSFVESEIPLHTQHEFFMQS